MNDVATTTRMPEIRADAWKQAASTPEGKTALANSCKQMLESTKTATKAMGCEW